MMSGLYLSFLFDQQSLPFHSLYQLLLGSINVFSLCYLGNEQCSLSLISLVELSCILFRLVVFLKIKLK